ncbi:uncharacterized protein DS421_19g635250 [Arachis hypogaea]|uniref:Uncharacterized protein n=1 Tax=Arachis hypogaea TaxID=3818 RepID=A0A6B9V4P7_ARAHY|nr:uncharacterized protein DS421_19g635250 [Arachis hypogaea]
MNQLHLQDHSYNKIHHFSLQDGLCCFSLLLLGLHCCWTHFWGLCWTLLTLKFLYWQLSP